MGRRIHNLILLTLELYSATVFSQVTTRQSHDRIELPTVTSADSLLIEHTGFSLSYNFDTNCPNWVAWNLTEEEAYSTQFKRSNDFRGDIMVPPLHRVEGYDYKQTEFNRGHMCPAGDMRWNADAMSECFLMSNICPQIPVLNHSSKSLFLSNKEKRKASVSTTEMMILVKLWKVQHCP